ncbi:MAG: GAF domain-containing protein [Nitrospirae bacterium]|nr:GAF domain-containing protein [Candidatus Manganitrophaceae bacterium]
MDDLEGLNEISALMTQGIEIDALFSKAFLKIQEHLPSLSIGALFLFSEERGTLELASSFQLPPEAIHPFQKNAPQLGSEVIEPVGKSGNAFFQDPQSDPGSFGASSEASPPLSDKGLFCGAVPLRYNRKVLGVFAFGPVRSGRLTPREQKWLQAVGDQMGLALERIRLQGVYLRREKEALALFHLSQAATSSLSIDAVVKIILNHVAEITDSEAIWIMLYNPTQRLLEMVAARGLSEQVPLNALILRPGQGILGEVFQREKPIVVPDMGKDPRLVYRDEAALCGITSLIGIPLMVKGKAIGVLSLFSPRSVEAGQIHQERLDFLTTVASQVAIAIDNAKLYQDLEQKVTELRRLQGQLIQTEKLSAIGELVSGVAHEINNPLTSVIGFTQLLLETTTNPRDRDFLEKIFSEAMSCSEIIRNLLTFARRHPAEKSFNNVNDLLRRALELKLYQLETDGIEVVERLSDAIPPAWVDPHQMQQVFFNIIHNAHQALLEKKKLSAGPLCLTLSSTLSNGNVSVSFHDTGTGILPEVLPKIFEPFFSTKEVGVGTGLGLSISYGIVKEHGGEILIENLYGQGVTFIVTFPLNEPEEGKKSGRSDRPGAYVGKKILIVDDTESVLEMCSYLLRAEGFHVDAVGSGQAALEHLRLGRYDLVLINAGLPGLPGPLFHDLILKEHPAVAERLLFLYEEGIDPEARRLLEERNQTLLAKPFGMIALKEAVYRSLTTSLKA